MAVASKETLDLRDKNIWNTKDLDPVSQELKIKAILNELGVSCPNINIYMFEKFAQEIVERSHNMEITLVTATRFFESSLTFRESIKADEN